MNIIDETLYMTIFIVQLNNSINANRNLLYSP
jgi:hypothetical protein